MGSKPKAPAYVPPAPIVATIAPRYAEGDVAEAGKSTRRRYSAGGQRSTILTSGQGASGAQTTRKTLLGQ